MSSIQGVPHYNDFREYTVKKAMSILIILKGEIRKKGNFSHEINYPPKKTS